MEMHPMSDKPQTATTVRHAPDGQWYYLSSDPFVDGQPVGQIRPEWVDEVMKRGNDMSDASTKTGGSLPVGTRVRYISDVRLSGVIEEYEFPGMLGMVFVRVNGGSGFWFHHFQLVKDVIR
jgi:hypothetical protein